MAAKKKRVAKVRKGVTGSLQVGNSNTFVELDPDREWSANDPIVVANPDCFEIEESD